MHTHVVHMDVHDDDDASRESWEAFSKDLNQILAILTNIEEVCDRWWVTWVGMRVVVQ